VAARSSQSTRVMLVLSSSLTNWARITHQRSLADGGACACECAVAGRDLVAAVCLLCGGRLGWRGGEGAAIAFAVGAQVQRVTALLEPVRLVGPARPTLSTCPPPPPPTARALAAYLGRVNRRKVLPPTGATWPGASSSHSVKTSCAVAGRSRSLIGSSSHSFHLPPFRQSMRQDQAPHRARARAHAGHSVTHTAWSVLVAAVVLLVPVSGRLSAYTWHVTKSSVPSRLRPHPRRECAQCAAAPPHPCSRLRTGPRVGTGQ
jgi:hypothetical protein